MNDTIGMDISKDKLDVFRLKDGSHRIFPNTASSIRAMRDWIGPAPERIVFEATGAYHRTFKDLRVELYSVMANEILHHGTGAIQKQIGPACDKRHVPQLPIHEDASFRGGRGGHA